MSSACPGVGLHRRHGGAWSGRTLSLAASPGGGSGETAAPDPSRDRAVAGGRGLWLQGEDLVGRRRASSRIPFSALSFEKMCNPGSLMVPYSERKRKRPREEKEKEWKRKTQILSFH